MQWSIQLLSIKTSLLPCVNIKKHLVGLISAGVNVCPLPLSCTHFKQVDHQVNANN